MTGILVVSGVLALVVAGCVCVVWAVRGGPRWVRAVAAVTLTAGELVRVAGRSGGGYRSGGSSDD
ncbi:hypothetical protein SUDANB58_05538 [Streptomyces sp. enrichment culture]|uniref:hypothetical protein n=1 Tax=Streptomyces sp. enrichment culture TaxID=1795815 RepID=UPI003F57D301